MAIRLSTAVARAVAAMLVTGVLASCALEQPKSPAELQREALPNTTIPAAWQAGADAGTLAASGWLASFGDPALTALVAEALAHNADLQVAAARVEEAGGNLQVASAGLLPSVNVPGTYSGKSGGGGGLNAIFLNASLELDVWGRVRYGKAAAQAQVEATEADYAYARQSLAATVAKAWFLAIEAGQQRALLQDSLRATQALHDVAAKRFNIGVGDESAVVEADANVGMTRDQLRQTEQARDEALRALELLLGRYPAAEIAVAQSLAPMPGPLPAGLPSELLERRPDVVAAERRVAAAFNRVGEAKAARLPRLSLTAGLSAISSDLLVLQNRDNPSFGVGATLFAPLYQGGALKAQVDIANAQQKQAMAEYAHVALQSFGQVENALGVENSLRDREVILASVIAANERSLQLAQTQYQVGKIDMRTVEQRQLDLVSIRTELLRVQTDRLAQRANLYLVLGGNFEASDTKPAEQGLQSQNGGS